jgi:hypothetical protein
MDIKNIDMIRFSKIFVVLFLPLVVMMSCQKESYNLEPTIDKSNVKFTVVQDLAADPGGNTVILTNETQGVLPIWDYGTGRSTRMRDTVRFAFKGNYMVKFSVLSGGSEVKLDSVPLVVSADNLSYVQDKEWIDLTGGPGNEKVWLLDTEGKMGAGPITFLNPANFSEVWWWPAPADVYPGVMEQGDYGSMTFSLKGGPFFRNEKLIEGGLKENGTFSLSIATKTLTLNGATILRSYKPSKNGITGVSNWSKYEIIEISENSLRLGVLRDKDVDGEGPAMLVYNFISKEYSDNWVPVETGPDEGFNPTFKRGELLNMLAGSSASGRMWLLDGSGNAVDWIGKGKGWTKSSNDSRDWGWNNSWDAVASSSWILFDRLGGQNYTRNQNGIYTRGQFTINEETNEVTLIGNTLIQNPDSWMNPTQNVFKVVKAYPGKEANKGIWFGTSYTAEKDEWFAFHYVLGSK